MLDLVLWVGLAKVTVKNVTDLSQKFLVEGSVNPSIYIYIYIHIYIVIHRQTVSLYHNSLPEIIPENYWYVIFILLIIIIIIIINMSYH